MKLRKFFCALCTAALLLSALPAALADGAPAFSDISDIRHQEAVAALVRLGVMQGKGDGGCFDPSGAVTRGEAAKMMALILTGGKDVSAGLPAQSSFPDVHGHWAEAYIEFCAQKGVAFAQEDGSFDPSGSVTQFELLRMAEVALGRQPGEFTNAVNWIGVTHAVALDRNLLAALDNFQGKPITDHSLTRDEAAQILYNALNATPQTLKNSSTGFFEDVKGPDGSPSTLLYECYGFRSWQDVPAPADQREPAPKADPTAFKDAAQISHWEAVAALCSLGIANGREDGAFHPADAVTRREAAKFIMLIMSGGEDLDNGVKETPAFSDIQGHWAETYIEYCADLGIISGRGDGAFDPDGLVTALELAKMAETALGYDADAYALNGSRWAKKVDELARSTDPSLYEGLDSVALDQPITRDNASQVLYNALRATPIVVAPDGVGEDGKVVWRFKPSGSTLLKDRFALDGVGALPAQPK